VADIQFLDLSIVDHDRPTPPHDRHQGCVGDPGGMPDTDGMWMLLRLAAIVILLVMGALIAGQGERLFGIGLVRPRSGEDPASAVVLGGVSLGAVVALVRPLDRVVGQLVTLLHELGHTIVAAALGARPAGIVLRHDASGHARARWVRRTTPARRFALATVAFAGVPAAAALSAAGAQLLLIAGPNAVLWSLAVAGAVVAVLARSPWSLLVAGGLGALAVAALRDAAEPWAAGVVVGLLTATAIKTTYDNARAVGHPIRAGDDARAVGERLLLPARVVQLVQILVAGALSGWTLWLLAPGLLPAT
jgi:hypothetical protein